MTGDTRQKQRRDAIRARLRAPLPGLASDLQRVEADIHSSTALTGTVGDAPGCGFAVLRSWLRSDGDRYSLS
jgi:hypothetical protein